MYPGSRIRSTLRLEKVGNAGTVMRIATPNYGIDAAGCIESDVFYLRILLLLY